MAGRRVEQFAFAAKWEVPVQQAARLLLPAERSPAHFRCCFTPSASAHSPPTFIAAPSSSLSASPSCAHAAHQTARTHACTRQTLVPPSPEAERSCACESPLAFALPPAAPTIANPTQWVSVPHHEPLAKLTCATSLARDSSPSAPELQLRTAT